MIFYSPVSSSEDLKGILLLQQENLSERLTMEEIRDQGFVTVRHTLEDLEKMHTVEPSIIAKEKDQVIAYILAMTMAAQNHLPILRPMFEIMRKIDFQDQPLLSHSFIMIGQVCVAGAYRGKGVFQATYAAFQDYFHPKYEFALTEIAARNIRSMRAHWRIGFETIHTYEDPNRELWNIVVQDWR